MKLEQLTAMAGVIAHNNVNMDMDISSICCDSRKVKEGAAFVAVRGFSVDGNEFIKDALRSGAACIITEKQLPPEIPHIVVEDDRRALSAVAAAWYGHPSGSFRLIGITGTNGKTTTTYLIKRIIERAGGGKVGLIGTNQIIIGDEEREAWRTTPESIELQELFAEMRDKGCKYVVMEVSSHSLSLGRVSDCDFDVGVFTNLTQDHLDFHGTMENYRDAKAKLFDMCKIGIFNKDDDAGEYIMDNARCGKMSYAIDSDDADVVAKNVKLSAAGVAFEALINGDIAHVSVGIPGLFSVYNVLAAVSACLGLGFSLCDIAQAIKDAHGVRGRAEVVYNGTFTVLVDYAHTPDGMENIIRTARGFTKGRVISVFGCGGDRDRKKRPIMGRIGTEMSDIALITSDNPRSEDSNAIIEDILKGVTASKHKFEVVPDRREAIRRSLTIASEGDVVLLLGKGHETYQEINGVKNHFDDREEVLKYFR